MSCQIIEYVKKHIVTVFVCFFISGSPCNESCRYKDALHCWGSGPNMCQVCKS